MRKVYFQIKFPELSYFPQELRERGLKAELIARDELESLMGLELSRGWKTKIRFHEFSIVCLPDYVDRSRRLVVEIKSTRGVKEPTKSWMGQLNLYMLALSYQSGILAQVGDSGILRISKLSFDETLAEESIAYFERLNYFVKNDIIPERELSACNRFNNFNRFCSFSDMCASMDCWP